MTEPVTLDVLVAEFVGLLTRLLQDAARKGVPLEQRGSASPQLLALLNRLAQGSVKDALDGLARDPGNTGLQAVLGVRLKESLEADPQLRSDLRGWAQKTFLQPAAGSASGGGRSVPPPAPMPPAAASIAPPPAFEGLPPPAPAPPRPPALDDFKPRLPPAARPPPAPARPASRPSAASPAPVTASPGPPPKRSLMDWFRSRDSAQEAVEDPAARYTNIRILDGGHGGVISMAEALRARHPYTLEVSIKVKRDADSLTAGRKDQAPVQVMDQHETVWVWVVLTDETDGDAAVEGKLFKLDHRYGALKLPVTGDSEGVVRFGFSAIPPRGVPLDRPRNEICPRIGIRIYHKLNLIDHTQLELRFTEKEAPVRLGRNDPAVRVDFMQVDGRPVEVPDPASAARGLTISISKPDPEAAYYRFALVMRSRKEAGNPGLFASRKLSADELDGFVSDFRDILLQAVFDRSLSSANLPVSDQEEVLSSLAALGDRIVASLFNYSQQGDLFEWSQMLREVLPQVSIIQIALGQGAQDLVFPWQILTLEDTDPDAPVDPRNLWGYRFVIEVKRCGDGVDPRPVPARSPETARVTYARWSFQNESTHYQRLKEIVSKSKFPAAIAAPIVEARAPFANALLNGGGELLYIYAHGHAAAPNTALGIRYRTAARTRISELRNKLEASPGLASGDLQEARRVQDQFLKVTRADGGSSLSLNNSDVELTYLLTQTSKARARLNDAPIVFMNTCESAQVWNALSDSFVAFFLDRGARAVLGTESTIPIVVADLFGQAVLESLFQGSTLGEAVHAARWQLLNKHRNPLGLCYCLYGAADARLKAM